MLGRKQNGMKMKYFRDEELKIVERKILFDIAWSVFTEEINARNKIKRNTFRLILSEKDGCFGSSGIR